jgi:hypothetical protein
VFWCHNLSLYYTDISICTERHYKPCNCTYRKREDNIRQKKNTIICHGIINFNFYGSVNIYKVVIMLINSRSYFIYTLSSLFCLPIFSFRCEYFVSTTNANKKIMSKDNAHYSHIDILDRVVLETQTEATGLPPYFLFTAICVSTYRL